MAWRKRSKKDVPIPELSEESLENLEKETAELVKTQLPIARVKKIVRLNPEVDMVNSDALQLMAKAAELFIKELSTSSNQFAQAEKRKTMQAKDIDKAIQKNWCYAFLEDALDGWPKMEPKKRNKAGNTENEGTEGAESTNPEEESQEDDVIEEEDEEIEEELPETVPEDSQHQRDVFAEQF